MARRVWIQIHHQESQLSSANDKVFGIICSLTGLPQKFRSLLAAVIFDPPGGPESFKPGVQLAHSQSIYHSVRAGARRNTRPGGLRSLAAALRRYLHYLTALSTNDRVAALSVCAKRAADRGKAFGKLE